MSGQTQSDLKSWGDILNPVEMQRHQQVGLLGIVALFVLPLVIPAIYAIYLSSALFFATFVMSWDFVSGYTGEISFGHGLFFGVGGYTSGMLNLHMGIDPWIAAPIGAVAAGIAGLLIGFPSLRVQGPYFSLITLVTPIILISVFRFFPDLTGGELGLVSVGTVEKFSAIGPIPSPGFDPYSGYYLALFVFLLALVIFVAITRSDAGMVLTAIRADEISVAATGKNPAKFKLFAFVLSGLVGGLAGAMYGHSVGGFNVSELLALIISIEVIVAAILGGIGTITGAAIGGLFFYLLRVFMRNIEFTIPVVNVPVGEIYFLLFGIVTLGFLFYLPEGIVPRLVGEWRARSEPQAGEAVADGGKSRGERIVEEWTDDLRELFGGERR
ncbi:branched-chain amino acid ABC transporter permease [Natronomonas sp. CBA1123]|uniref:branched-chain amino acid ABC transporter permease n=1 Tax=Natronomonas sp. CBA1123 TaxID=2668070 RepID=UPI0012EAE05D|nr:branched-chain amino acid ABC transporter permease [Natronomonas sp. CBA1123]MUV86094.1 branched-chain amino acid ABC transporter permease [Natronomonas sp. CBA1123]